MFKIMKGMDKIGAVQFFSRVDSLRIRGQSLRVKKMRIRIVLRQRSFSRKVDNAWNGLPGNVVAVEGVDMFTLKLDGYLDALEIKRYQDIGKNGR